MLFRSTAASKYAAAKHRDLGCASKNEALYNLFAANDGDWFARLESIVKTAIPDPDISRDLLKSPPLTATILANVDRII